MKKKLPIGIDNYKKLIAGDYYYVDKTLLIKELLDKGGEVSLFTRPRRFGKSLALSMLRTFFEDERTIDGEKIDNRIFFAETNILENGPKYANELGQYPVIFLSLKSAKQPDFETAYYRLKMDIAREFERHRYVLDSDIILDSDKALYCDFMNRTAKYDSYTVSLQFLSRCLELYHGKKTIILLDEYDVPLENAYFKNFYDKMINFIQSLFESALKTNESLQFAVLTGCLRISRESIFTGLNNLEIVSILNEDYSEFFGFTSKEAAQLLSFYGLEEKSAEMKLWYDGYLFGNTEVYNPWSVINYVKTGLSNRAAFPKPYWSNTSSNSIVQELVENADSDQRQELEHLIAGGTIEKAIHEEITYSDIHQAPDNLWNFLFFTGYLKAVSQRLDKNQIFVTIEIPNEEIRYIYQNTIRYWFEQQIRQADKTPLQQAMLAGDVEQMEALMRRQLMESISYFDNSENFYHGYLVGMLGETPEYFLRSNREAGTGRPDIQLISYDLAFPAIIVEVKRADNYQEMDLKCEEALQQIEARQYDEELRLEGYQKFIHFGICFCKKNCRIRMKQK